MESFSNLKSIFGNLNKCEIGIYKNYKLDTFVLKKTFRMKHLFFLFLLIFNTLLMAQNNTLNKTVTVTANATMEVSPDEVVYSININQKRPSFEQAYDALDKEINKAIDLLIKEKVKKSAIKTTTYNVQKNYRWKGDKRMDDGFIATSRIEAKTALDTRRINKVLARFGKVSPDLNLNIGFSISDDLLEITNEKLLTNAVIRAKKKANIICTALGKRLGDISSVTYNEGGYSRPVVYHKSMSRSSTMAMDENAGSIENVKEIKMDLNVHSIWEIE